MSLRQVKTVYCLAAITLALILVYAGGLVCWIAAISLLTGSLPLFSIIRRTAEQEYLEDADAALTTELNRRRGRQQQHRAYGG